MLFSSILFLFFFLPAALLLYFASPRGWRLGVLTLCSYAFYAWSDPRCLLLLLWVTIADYTFGNLLATKLPSPGIPGEGGVAAGEGLPKPGATSGSHPNPLPAYRTGGPMRRLLLIASLTNSIGMLFWFKYAGFAQQIANSTLAMFGVQGWTILRVVLPLGISFYTFESISYVIDIYRGIAHPAGERFRVPGRSRIAAEARGLVAFACYLAQFPHLVAGPIIRFQELETQLQRPRVSLTRMAKGILLFSFGLAKKVLIADTFAPVVDASYSGFSLNMGCAWYAVIAFAMQIYFDFSGYTDMAMGLGMMLGFRFPQNFNAPYRAIGIADFWRRWHITLSRWLRDYVYISLGGNRKGRSRTMINLLLTMLIGGIWHGAAWTFILWGLYNGVWLALERLLRRRQPVSGWRVPVATAATFVGVCIGWVLFRAPTPTAALGMYLAMFLPFQPTAGAMADQMLHAADLLAMLAGAAIVFSGIEAWPIARRLTWPRIALAVMVLLASLLLITIRASTPFLYFKF
jgi:alginate O-acetyltransferase complex protein AlgI